MTNLERICAPARSRLSAPLADLLAPQSTIIDSGLGPAKGPARDCVRFAVFLLRSPEARRSHDAAAVTVPPLNFNVRQSCTPRVGPVRQRKRKRQRLGESTVPAKRLRAERPNHVWALDFQFDTTSDGRTLKLLHSSTSTPRGAGDAGGPLDRRRPHDPGARPDGCPSPAHCSTSQRLKELLGQRSRQCGRPRARPTSSLAERFTTD